MADIAREAGVSKNTVSLALRNDPQIPERTRRKIERIASRLGYCKNATVAHLMAQLRKQRQTGARATLALVNAHLDRRAFAKHPTIPAYVAGCRHRAAQLGYGLDEFWLHDPSLDGATLNAILRARGIRGIVVVGLMRENRLPERFLRTWQEFPSVVTGVRTREPALSFACTDHHDLTRTAVEEAGKLGYQRPGLVLDGVIDDLVDGRFSAGFLIAQRALPARQRLRPFYRIADTRENAAVFERWMGEQKPDVILTLYNEVRDWLRALHLRAPHDIGLMQLEWRASDPEWAGMNQHNDIAGEAAIEMVIAMIQNGESGIPAFPRSTLIGSTWVAGPSVVATDHSNRHR